MADVGHTVAVAAVAYARDGKRLASVDRGGTLIEWDLAKATPLRRARHPLGDTSDAVECLAFSPNGRLLASGAHNAVLWNAATLSATATVACSSGAGRRVVAVSFTPDSERLALCASGDGAAVETKRARDGAPVAQLDAPGAFRVIHLSPERLLVGCEGGARLCDAAGAPLGELGTAPTARLAASARDDRYPSVTALHADIEAYVAGRMVGAARYSVLGALGKWVAAHRVVLGAAAAVALAAITVAGTFALRDRRARFDAIARARANLIALDPSTAIEAARRVPLAADPADRVLPPAGGAVAHRRAIDADSRCSPRRRRRGPRGTR